MMLVISVCYTGNSIFIGIRGLKAANSQICCPQSLNDSLALILGKSYEGSLLVLDQFLLNTCHVTWRSVCMCVYACVTTLEKYSVFECAHFKGYYVQGSMGLLLVKMCPY